MIKGKVYECKYKFTYDKLQQPTIRFNIYDYNANVIRVIIKNSDISNCNYVEAVIKNIDNNTKNTQTDNISINNNVIEIKLNDEYIDTVGQYIVQLSLYNKDNDKVLERAVIKPISFIMED